MKETCHVASCAVSTVYRDEVGRPTCSKHGGDSTVNKAFVSKPYGGRVHTAPFGVSRTAETGHGHGQAHTEVIDHEHIHNGLSHSHPHMHLDGQTHGDHLSGHTAAQTAALFDDGDEIAPTGALLDAKRRRWAKGWARRRVVLSIAGEISREFAKARIAREVEAAVGDALRRAGWL